MLYSYMYAIGMLYVIYTYEYAGLKIKRTYLMRMQMCSFNCEENTDSLNEEVVHAADANVKKDV